MTKCVATVTRITALLSLFGAMTVHALLPAGADVKKIPFASNLDGWHAIDNRHVILTFTPAKNYLLTLNRDCHGLNFASHLGVTTSNDAIYAGFDYITADGRRCGIQTINRLSREQKTALTRA